MASLANKGYMSNAGFVVTDDGVVVFDALGTPALGRAMIAAIRKVTPAPIRRVIVSHYHADHIYGLQALKSPGTGDLGARQSQGLFHLRRRRSAARAARVDLAPWSTRPRALAPPDVWLDGDTDFRLAA